MPQNRQMVVQSLPSFSLGPLTGNIQVSRRHQSSNSDDGCSPVLQSNNLAKLAEMQKQILSFLEIEKES